jgi:hypothetical protein
MEKTKLLLHFFPKVGFSKVGFSKVGKKKDN